MTLRRHAGRLASPWHYANCTDPPLDNTNRYVLTLQLPPNSNAALTGELGVIATRARHAVPAAALSAYLLVAHGTATGDPAAGERLAAARCISCHSSTETTHSMLP